MQDHQAASPPDLKSSNTCQPCARLLLLKTGGALTETSLCLMLEASSSKALHFEFTACLHTWEYCSSLCVSLLVHCQTRVSKWSWSGTMWINQYNLTPEINVTWVYYNFLWNVWYLVRFHWLQDVLGWVWSRVWSYCVEIEWMSLLSFQNDCIYFQSTLKENTEEWFSVWRPATSCVTSVAVRSSYSLGGFISKQHISKATQTVFMDGWSCFLKCYCKYIWGGGII